MSAYSKPVTLSIAVSGGTGQVAVANTDIVQRTVFDGPDSAEYDWLVTTAAGKPIAGRADQIGDKIIVEEYPVYQDAIFKILNADTDGTYIVDLYLWPPMV